MCGSNDLQVAPVGVCSSEGRAKKDEEEDGQEDNNSSNSINSRRNSSVEKVWTETQQMMDQREQLVRIMTHVCSRQLSGAYRTLARYSQGCWRGCDSAKESLEGRRGVSHPYYVHLHTSPSPLPSTPPPSASHHSTCPTYSSPSSAGQLQVPFCSSASCKGCMCCGCSGDLASVTSASGYLTQRHPLPQQQQEEEEEEHAPTPAASLSCRWCGGCCCHHGRWRWGRSCQGPCTRSHPNCCRRCLSSALMLGMGGGGGGTTWPCSTSPSCCSPSQHPVGVDTPSSSTTSTTAGPTTQSSHCHPVPPCPTTTATTTVSSRATTTTKKSQQQQEKEEESLPSAASSPSYAPAARALPSRRRTLPPSSVARTASPKSSVLTILLLLVVTLARFTDGCSSRSTPKPRPASPTMRPNITFQTYACPPAYAAWYCLNGATCFTVKIGESILYNCECADGYMGQRCEFKDLDGSYIPAREKVLLETASIAGGATVACVLVFIVLFAVYIFMQKDKDKRCRDLDDGRDNDRQPFSGYQNPRPEVFRTISNPYARTLDELSHVEVESAGHGVSAGTVGRIGSGSTGGGGGGNPVDSNPHHNGKQQQQQQTTSTPTAL